MFQTEFLLNCHGCVFVKLKDPVMSNLQCSNWGKLLKLTILYLASLILSLIWCSCSVHSLNLNWYWTFSVAYLLIYCCCAGMLTGMLLLCFVITCVTSIIKAEARDADCNFQCHINNIVNENELMKDIFFHFSNSDNKQLQLCSYTFRNESTFDHYTAFGNTAVTFLLPPLNSFFLMATTTSVSPKTFPITKRQQHFQSPFLPVASHWKTSSHKFDHNKQCSLGIPCNSVRRSAVTSTALEIIQASLFSPKENPPPAQFSSHFMKN